MIPLLTDGVDVVTASPYHPRGRSARTCRRWRLFLSKVTLARSIGSSCTRSLHTYTSCFRVYRRQRPCWVSVVRRTGFLGVAEMLGRLDLAGRQDRRVPDDARGPRPGSLEDEGAPHDRGPPGPCSLSLARRLTGLRAACADPRRCRAPAMKRRDRRWGAPGYDPGRAARASQGHRVTVLEGGLAVRGPGRARPIGEYTWDRFYHVVLQSDQLPARAARGARAH